MHLKSLTLKGFKSFPDSTRLDFGRGVSVVVGPNGSGKSNVTDAVLWAMGEQSPLAIRGQSMQDVIFAGGRGAQARSSAQVEIVLDNSDATVGLPLSEISIVRRLDRTGDGGYLLNGARCRLADVTEVLSDTGLGKEAHSVISQGRVEEIVSSKPRGRRLLIEEAAGLGKHRKRRRRAQLKLEHTQDNLDRALDVEREARTRLRPLKRQAEAAELHERLERQLLEARWQLVKDQLRARRAELAGAEAGVRLARERRAEVEARLQTVVERRAGAEQALTERTERHDALSARLYAARSARDRVALRGEQALTASELLERRIERVERRLERLEQAAEEHEAAGRERPHDDEDGHPAPAGSGDSGGASRGSLAQAWEDVRDAIERGVERAHAEADPRARARAVAEVVAEVRRLSEVAVALAVERSQAAGDGPADGGSPVAQLVDRRDERLARVQRLRESLAAEVALMGRAEHLASMLAQVADAIEHTVIDEAQNELARDGVAGEEVAGELRACAREEAEIQSELRGVSEVVTEEEVAAQRLRDQTDEAQESLQGIGTRLGVEEAQADDEGGEEGEPLGEEEVAALEAREARLARRREQLGPVNPLAQEEYAEALEHVEELETRRADLETALRELRSVIRDTDRQIRETFEQTFQAAAENFSELASDLFPGGAGKLRLVGEERSPRPVLGGEPLPEEAAAQSQDDESDEDDPSAHGEEELMGVEIEITPAGKSTKRLSLLSGGEKSMTALAFLFAVFLARPCPFYILDEVEAALDDVNLDRFLALLRRYSDRAQFIVITHQKRTMEAADWLYGVSMAQDGVSKVVSRRLPANEGVQPHDADAPGTATGDVAEVA